MAIIKSDTFFKIDLINYQQVYIEQKCDEQINFIFSLTAGL